MKRLRRIIDDPATPMWALVGVTFVYGIVLIIARIAFEMTR